MLDDFKPKKPVGAARIKLNRSAAHPGVAAAKVSSETPFTTPEAVAAAEPAPDPAIIPDPSVEPEATTEPIKRQFEPPTDLKSPLSWWPPKAWNRKQWLLLVGGAVVLAAIITSLLLVFVFHKKSPIRVSLPAHKTVKVAPKPTTVPSRLTGLPVSIAQSQLPVTGIMIENSTDARPQSGLDQAGVVFEAVAEGGITRFLALFEDNQPPYVGPVRSSRPYYLRWLLPFDAAYAHVGGSADALSDISTLRVKDMDQFYNGAYYERIDSRDAPHNVYTSLSQLLALEKSKHYDTSTFTGFTRKKEAPSGTPNATSVDFTISGPAYSVHYDYVAGTNSYNRSEGGAPHMVVDASGGQTQLSPNVVIALVMNQSSGALDASGAYYTEYNTIGSGQMYVFQDGTVTTGTWNKADDKSQFVFDDDRGNPIALNPGQTWISVVGLPGDVSYK